MNELKTKPNPLILIILDGWGYSQDHEHNAIASAQTPNYDYWIEHYPNTLIQCQGEAVGLPKGQMGNSEVGHMHIGAGRVVHQDLSRIDLAVTNNDFAANPTLQDAIAKARQNQSAIHVMGLLSPGGVHSHENHIFALADILAEQDVPVFYHPFLDGRDTPPQSALTSIQALEKHIHDSGGLIASISGRYYAMDRDQRFLRTQLVYDLLTQGTATYHADTATTALQEAYARGENDEFVTPCRIAQSNDSLIKDGDVVIFMNFRADRARQLTNAFTQPEFDGFKRNLVPKLAGFYTLTQYSKDSLANAIFKPTHLTNTFGDYIAQQNLKQFRVAETEKYAHVTFFLNGGNEAPFPGEERTLIPSPKVATYDLQPEMSAPELTKTLVNAIESENYDVIICNYANADMVGHTGNVPATVQAIECLDRCLGEVVNTALAQQGEVIITADHGNAEKMYDEQTQQIHTAHTNTDIPLLYIGRKASIRSGGSLVDVAPTMLYLMGLDKPQEMTGQSLLTLR